MTKQTDRATDAEKDYAQETAERTVENLFLRLGIDPDDKDVLHRLRDDLMFLARLKRGASQVSGVIIKTCAGAVVMAFIWMLTQGFKDWIWIPGIK